MNLEQMDFNSLANLAQTYGINARGKGQTKELVIQQIQQAASTQLKQDPTAHVSTDEVTEFKDEFIDSSESIEFQRQIKRRTKPQLDVLAKQIDRLLSGTAIQYKVVEEDSAQYITLTGGTKGPESFTLIQPDNALLRQVEVYKNARFAETREKGDEGADKTQIKNLMDEMEELKAIIKKMQA